MTVPASSRTTRAESGLVDAFMAAVGEDMRGIGRVPRKLTVIVDLPEIPMGNEAGANVTHHVDFDKAAADPGLIGAATRALTRNDPNG